jgi:hypothetical protein
VTFIGHSNKEIKIREDMWGKKTLIGYKCLQNREIPGRLMMVATITKAINHPIIIINLISNKKKLLATDFGRKNLNNLELRRLRNNM